LKRILQKPYMSGVLSSAVSERAEHRNADGRAGGDSETLPMNTRLVEHGNRKSVPDVPERVKAAAEFLAENPGPIDYQKIAAAVGYRDAKAARRALSLPQSVRYLREHKRAVLDAICLHNPEALRRVRDGSQNGMAVTAAVRQLEVMQNGDDASDVARTPRQSAGITIIVEASPGAAARVLPPAIDAEPGGHIWPRVD
jgi:hypothetical protein